MGPSGKREKGTVSDKIVPLSHKTVIHSPAVGNTDGKKNKMCDI